MLQDIFNLYVTVEKIDLKENTVKMIGPYDFTELLAQLIGKLENGQGFALAGGQKIADAMMVSRGIILLSYTAMLNEYIHEWR